MPYLVLDFGDLTDDDAKRIGDAEGDRDRLEASLNALEQQGWTLQQIQQQYRSWDDEGESEGMNQSLYVFHADKAPNTISLDSLKEQAHKG